jgi:hypothetical protein
MTMNAKDLYTIISANSNVPNPVNFTLKEVAVCETDSSGKTVEKRMIVLASDTYLPKV